MPQQALSLPSEIYYIAGVLILTNLGTIGSIAWAALKGVWWLSKLDSKTDEAKATAVRAHKRIDILEGAKESVEEK